MKSLSVNMPVLKILGGASIRELLDYTMDNLPGDIKEKLEGAPVAAEAPLDISLLKSSIPDSKTPSTMAGSATPDHESTDRSLSRDKCDDSSEITDYLSAAGEISSPPSVSGDDEKLGYPINTQELSRKLKKVEPLSYSQSMFWFVTVYLDDATTLNHTGAYRLHGAIRKDDLSGAVTTLATNHEILRTCFFADEQNSPVQGIMESSLLHLETRAVDDEAGALREVELMKKHVFDLEQGKTMRLVLLSQSSLEHYLIIGCHHIITDGTSHQVFMADLEKAYNGQASSTVLQYSTFGNQQREKYAKTQIIPELKFWREEFSTIPSPLPSLLPRDIPRRPLSTYSVHRVDFRVEKSLNNRVRQACRQSQATPFHFYLTIFRLLLTQLTGVDELCIGMAEANRKDERMMQESALGPYVNLLPLHFRSEKQQSFLTALSETRRKVYAALANSDVPFEVLLDELRVSRSTLHSPLFQSFIDYRQGAKEKLTFSNCELEVLDFEAGRTGYDISLDIIDNPGDDCLLMLMTQGSLYTEEETEFFMSSYTHLLRSLVENVSAVPDIYSPEDKARALALGRGTFRESQWPATLVHRVEDITAKYSNDLAIQDENGYCLTYAQLNTRVQSIAAALLSAGLKPGDAIAVYQEPSSDFICALLAILRIGSIYVPFDHSTPATRLANMAVDASISAIIVHRNTAQASLELKAKLPTNPMIINVSTIVADEAFAPISAHPEAPATILYTSGSTGKPKGILLTHSNLRNEIEFSGATYSIKRESVLQQSSFGFDMSFTQIFSALAFGGVLHIAPRSIRGDAIALYNLIVDEKITFTAGTPSEYVSWLRSDNTGLLKKSSWRTAVSGGEHISPVFLQQLRSLDKKDLQVFNSYGPTEITCSAARLKLSIESASGPISAGLPAPNCAIYILNESLDPVITGFPGEIFVGGAGVASGYLDHNITKGSFLHDPFALADFKKHGWDRMYRTGDTGRWLKDGTILIEGRITGDTQVKLRGLRVDLQDLEQAIVKTSDGAVAEAVASVRSTGSGQPEFLVAHVVFSAGVSADAIEETLAQTKSHLPLPQYMHPAIVIPVAEMPRNANGKLDRKAINTLQLPQVDDKEAVSSTLTDNEAQILKLWRSVLPPGASKGTTIDSLTDFFDIGGNSLLLLNLQAKIRQSFGVTLPLIKLFEAPTIRGMSVSVKNVSSGQDEKINWEAETEIPTSFYDIELSAVLPESKAKIVVLTGASGFLGQGLLRGLLADDTTIRIHCIAVRNPASLDAFASNPKLVVHSGDLTLPNLGLSTTAAQEIFGEATVVVHNGADVSHLKAFQTLKRANLESTKELVKLCLPRRIPFHYISTAGVVLRAGVEEFGEASVTPYVTPASDSDGYTASKWCSERFLEKINQQFHLQSWIHRPTSIMREGDPGLDLLQNLLKYVKRTREVPKSTKLQGFFDMVYLDTVVGRVIRSLRCAAEESLSYVNHSGDLLVPFSDLVGYLEKENRGRFTTCTMDEWVAKAEAAGMNQLVAEVFKHVEEGSPVTYPKFLKRAL